MKDMKAFSSKSIDVMFLLNDMGCCTEEINCEEVSVIDVYLCMIERISITMHVVSFQHCAPISDIKQILISTDNSVFSQRILSK